MRLIKWLVALIVLSILMATALALPSEKGCTCSPCGCHDKVSEGRSDKASSAMSCGGSCSHSSYSTNENACSCQILPSYFTLAYDPADSYVQRSNSRDYAKGDHSAGFSSHKIGLIYPDSDLPTPDYQGLGPPDVEVIEFLPPSARLVFKVLESEGPLTQKDLINRTDLPPRTVRYALGRLKEECVIKEGFNFRDARQSLYGLNTEAFKVAQI